MTSPGSLYVTPVMVKLALQCPRQLWLSYHTWFKPKTYSMIQGKKKHLEVPWDKIALKIGASEIKTNVYMESWRHPLKGIIDAVARVGEELRPIEYKYQTWIGMPEKIQTTLYAFLLEENTGTSVTRAYIIIPSKIISLKITGALRRRAINALNHTLKTILKKLPPKPTTSQLCRTCPYRTYCRL